jgi:hypothetical protein
MALKASCEILQAGRWNNAVLPVPCRYGTHENVTKIEMCNGVFTSLNMFSVKGKKLNEFHTGFVSFANIVVDLSLEHYHRGFLTHTARDLLSTQAEEHSNSDEN